MNRKYSTKEVMEITGLNRRSIQRHIVSGELETTLERGRRWVTVKSLAKWWHNGTHHVSMERFYSWRNRRIRDSVEIGFAPETAVKMAIEDEGMECHDLDY